MHAIRVAEVVRLRAEASRDRPTARILTNSAIVHAKGSAESNFATCAAANPTDLVSVAQVILHYATAIVELDPAELASVES